MAAHIIVDVDVKDAKAFEAYKQPTAASIAQHGGRFIIRSSEYEVLEGRWRPARLVVLEFPTVEAAKRWYESEEYRKVMPIRLRHAVSNMILVNGI
ncbi:MAG: DUF1330 domain-containing protein [candidate division NC10 bacterium]|nr:DUF1330 domain-containing protein [candidate division NC10 bacterium]